MQGSISVAVDMDIMSDYREAVVWVIAGAGQSAKAGIRVRQLHCIHAANDGKNDFFYPI